MKHHAGAPQPCFFFNIKGAPSQRQCLVIHVSSRNENRGGAADCNKQVWPHIPQVKKVVRLRVVNYTILPLLGYRISGQNHVSLS